MGPQEQVGWTVMGPSIADGKLREAQAIDKLLGRFRLLTVIKREGRIVPL